MPVYPGALQAQDLRPEQRFRASAKIADMSCPVTFLLVLKGASVETVSVPNTHPTRSRYESVLVNEATEDLGSS